MATEDNGKDTNESEGTVEEQIIESVNPIDGIDDEETDDQYDWDALFDDFELEDITPSDERKEINSSKEFINKQKESYIEFDKEFYVFLKNFVSTQHDKEIQKSCLKEAFFWIIMIGFLFMIVTPIFLICSVESMSDSNAIVALVSVLIELVTAIIVLPKIIAEYLFNKEEDKDMMKIIDSMQKYNEKKHDYFDKK